MVIEHTDSQRKILSLHACRTKARDIPSTAPEKIYIVCPAHSTHTAQEGVVRTWVFFRAAAVRKQVPVDFYAGSLA